MPWESPEGAVQIAADTLLRFPRADFYASGGDFTDTLTDVLRELMVRTGQCSPAEAEMLTVQINGTTALHRTQRAVRP